MCECPGSPFPCHGAGLASLQPWWGLAQHSLGEHSKENSQPLGKGNLPSAPLLDTMGFTGTELERLKAPCLDPAFTPVTSTGCLPNWALLVGAQRSADSHQSFHNFLPLFDAVAWLLSMALSDREPKMNCKGTGACVFVWLFFPSQSPSCCFINALLTHTCARGGQGTFASQK